MAESTTTTTTTTSDVAPRSSDAVDSLLTETTAAGEAVDAGKVASAVQFLTAPRLQAKPWETRVAFLRKKGLSDAELDQAQKRAKAILASSSSSSSPAADPVASAPPPQANLRPPPMPVVAMPPVQPVFNIPAPPQLSVWQYGVAPAAITSLLLGGAWLTGKLLGSIFSSDAAQRHEQSAVTSSVQELRDRVAELGGLIRDQRSAAADPATLAELQAVRKEVGELTQILAAAQQRRTQQSSAAVAPNPLTQPSVSAASLASQLRRTAPPSSPVTATSPEALLQQLAQSSAPVSSIPVVNSSPVPSTVPSTIPSTVPSTIPSPVPPTVPSTVPSTIPSTIPSPVPPTVPSTIPTIVPSPVVAAPVIAAPSPVPTTVTPSAVTAPAVDSASTPTYDSVLATLQRGEIPQDIDQTIDDTPRQAAPPASVTTVAAPAGERPWEVRRKQRRAQRDAVGPATTDK